MPPQPSQSYHQYQQHGALPKTEHHSGGFLPEGPDSISARGRRPTPTGGRAAPRMPGPAPPKASKPAASFRRGVQWFVLCSVNCTIRFTEGGKRQRDATDRRGLRRRDEWCQAAAWDRGVLAGRLESLSEARGGVRSIVSGSSQGLYPRLVIDFVCPETLIRG